MASPEQQDQHLERHAWRLVYWAFAASILCIAGNITILTLERAQFRAPSATDARELEFASTYMGLDRALRSSSAHSSQSSIVNFPVAFAVVDSSSPEKVFVDTPSRVTPFGTHFPEDRRLLLSSTVSPEHVLTQSLCSQHPLEGDICAVLGGRLWHGTL